MFHPEVPYGSSGSWELGLTSAITADVGRFDTHVTSVKNFASGGPSGGRDCIGVDAVELTGAVSSTSPWFGT